MIRQLANYQNLNFVRYARRAKLVSSQYRDQRMTPMETAVYWVEYIARHKGAPHMRSAGQDLSWFALYNLDIYAFVLMLVVLVLYGVKRLFWTVLGRNTTSASKQKKL